MRRMLSAELVEGTRAFRDGRSEGRSFGERRSRKRHASDDPLQDQLERLEALNEIARIATRGVELRPMLQRIAEALTERFGWEFVACMSVDRDRDRFVVEAIASSVPTDLAVGHGRALGSGIVGEVAATGLPILADDVRERPGYVETSPGARSELCVPVLYAGDTIAVLNVESPRLAAFHGQLPLLQGVAEQVAGAIHCAHVYEDARRRAADLAMLNRSLAVANEELEQSSTTDSLTKVRNRRFFAMHMVDELKLLERTRSELAPGKRDLVVYLIDVDRFKEVNDTLGHAAGDRLLVQIAGRLQRAIRGSDLLIRWGGDEFVVLSRGADRLHGAALAQRILGSIRRHAFELGRGIACSVTCSVGWAPFPWDPDDAGAATFEDVLVFADRALYVAKQRERDNAVGLLSADREGPVEEDVHEIDGRAARLVM